MKRVKLLELGKKGVDFDYRVPAGTSMSHITEGLALFLIDWAKYRGVSTETILAEMEVWVRQLKENL